MRTNLAGDAMHCEVHTTVALLNHRSFQTPSTCKLGATGRLVLLRAAAWMRVHPSMKDGCHASALNPNIGMITFNILEWLVDSLGHLLCDLPMACYGKTHLHWHSRIAH
jgi:hypothetical protein